MSATSLNDFLFLYIEYIAASETRSDSLELISTHFRDDALIFARDLDKMTKYGSNDLAQLTALRGRSPFQFDKVAQVFTYLAIAYPNMELPSHYLIDKPEVAFVLRFNLVAFHVVFNVVSDDEPEDTRTDEVMYSVQRFHSLPSQVNDFKDVELAVRHLIVALGIEVSPKPLRDVFAFERETCKA